MDVRSQSSAAVQTENRRLDTSRLYQEGFVAGTLGAAMTATWLMRIWP